MKEEDKQLGGKEAQNEMHTMIPSEADESSPPKILNMDDILRHLRTGPWNLYITIVCSFGKNNFITVRAGFEMNAFVYRIEAKT